MMIRTVAALAFLAGAPVAQAQTDLLEYREFEAEAEEGKLTVDGSFETSWYEYNNLDFRAINESSDQAILDSDDRGGFPFTGAAFAMAYQVEPGVEFHFAASHRGLWGSDQIGSTNRFGSMLYVTSLYADFMPAPEAEHPLKITVGRKNYKIGGIADGRDYVLQDTLDLVMVEIPIGIGTAEVMPVNVITQTDNDGMDFVGYMGQGDLPTFNFRGDTMSRRHGVVFRLDELPGPVDGLLYGFYTDVGAGVSSPEDGMFSTGVDISYQGLLGNFTDNDWVANFGLRVAIPDLPVRPYAHIDMSTGIDRKELVAEDVDTNGFAWGGGVSAELGDFEDADGKSLPDTESKGFTGQMSYFEAMGPAYQSDGMLSSHGYVGMKAQQVGGMLFNTFMGLHPTAYIGMFGVSDSPQESDRKSGTRVQHVNAGYDLGKPWARASWWYLQDTGITGVTNFGRLDQLDPPFGYSRDEFRAEERLGKAIGQELNLDLGYQITEHVEVHGSGGIILPGPYYQIEISRVAGNALGSSDPAMPWAASAGLSVKF